MRLSEYTLDERPDLVPATVRPALGSLVENFPTIRIVEIDPELADGAAFCQAYGVPVENGLNCVVVEGVRADVRSVSACLAPVGYKLRLNSAVRKRMGVRRVSLLDKEELLLQSGMEYGSVTPVGLPSGWSVLLPTDLESLDYVVVGGGLRKSKLKLPPAALMSLPNASAVEQLLAEA